MDLTSGSLALDDANFTIALGNVRHLCNSADTHIAVVIDPLNDLPDTDTTNNVIAVPFSFMDCQSMSTLFVFMGGRFC